MSEERFSRFRALIQARLASLADADAAKREHARPVELDQTRVGRLSRQDALQSQAMSAASLARNRAEIGRLRAALARLDEGEFGACEACGEEIPEARLEIDPAAEYCVGCARRREQR